MSRRSRTARLRRAVVAVGAVAAVGAASAVPAQAAFTLGKCQGTATSGAGASFQNTAQDSLWRTQAFKNYCADTGVDPSPTGSNLIAPYTDATFTGSGYGRRVLGERTNGAPTIANNDNTGGAQSRSPQRGERFGGTDEPPTSVAVNDINRGTDASGDEAQVRTIPVAVGAIAVVVNTPNGCSVFNGAAPVVNDPDTPVDETTLYSDANNADRERVRFTKAILEDIWAGDGGFDQWGDVFGDNVVSTDPAARTDQQCRDQAIVRVVRADDSGSTFVFKDFLNAIDPAEGWLTTFTTPDTRTWPNPDRVVNGADSLIPGATNGGGGLRTTTSDTDGSISYLELSGARGGTGSPFVRQAGADDRFWVQVQNGDDAFFDPASQEGSFASTAAAARGARCSAITDFRGIPAGDDPTADAAGWTAASGVNTTSDGQYGICSLTYILAWDDQADAYGLSQAEEGRARTVKDYLASIMTTTGQANLTTVDQSPLPLELRDRAVTGVNGIDFCTEGCPGAPVTNSPTTNTGTNPAPAPPNGNQTVIPPQGGDPTPSNVFSIRSVRGVGQGIRVALRLPGAGTATTTATLRYTQVIKRKGKKALRRARTLRFGRASVNVANGQDIAITVARTKAAKNALRRALKGRGKVAVSVTYTPAGGSAATQSASRRITVKRAAR